MSLTENSWMLHPFDKASLRYCAPDRTIPSLNTVLRAKRHRSVPQWSKAIARSYNMSAELAPDGGARTYRTWSGAQAKTDRHPIASPAGGCLLPLMPSWVRTHRSGINCSWGATSKNFRSGTHRFGDTLTLHPQIER
jgi:hypothetical protein